MDVSIIIINYNTRELTQNCINSIFDKTKNISFEVILVDNASTDGSKECFEKDSRIRYIYSPDNLGFGKGNNLGFQYAQGEYIFLLNSDTELINNAIFELANFLSEHPEISIVGGALYNKEMQPCNSYGLLLPSLFKELDMLFRGILTSSHRKKIDVSINENGYATVGYITGADMMLRRDSIEKVGLFDPDFFMYYEETEMTYRHSVNNNISVFFPAAKIHHFEGKSFEVKETRERMYLTSRKLYYHKTGHSKLYYYSCTLIYLLYLISSLLKSFCTNNKSQVKNTSQVIKLTLKYA
jgi:GT2 family glycosyltransferase